MSTLLVVKDGSIPEAKIMEMVDQGQYDAAVEADERNDLCVVYTKDGQMHEYLLDLFSNFDPVPFPRKNTAALYIFYTAVTLEKFVELTADDFSMVYPNS